MSKRKNTVERMKERMKKLDTQTIIEAISSTWDEPAGLLMREVGFEVIEEREGEEVADGLYVEVWEKMQRAA